MQNQEGTAWVNYFRCQFAHEAAEPGVRRYERKGKNPSKNDMPSENWQHLENCTSQTFSCRMNSECGFVSSTILCRNVYNLANVPN